MKLRCLILIVFLAAVAQPAMPQETNGPLGKDQVLDLVKFGLASGNLAKRIKERGIDFAPTDDCLETLRKAGAEEMVINALREARPKPLTREQVGKLVAGGVPNQRAAMLVKQHGIDFLADERYLQTLRAAGADDALLTALREAGKGSVRENPKDGLKYVWIPSGTFLMGCSPKDNLCFNVEKPAHRVTITKGFWMEQTEITVGAYKRFATVTGRKMPDAPGFNRDWADEKMPIVNVTWNDAHDYCAWAGGRLPTEAEWEYAARGGSREAWYGILDDIAWYRKNSGGQTHEVAQKHANGFGLFDMLGNASEWVNDWHEILGENYYRHSPASDPQGQASGDCRILRGGAWGSDARSTRVSAPDWNSPDMGSESHGSRCILSLDPLSLTRGEAPGAVLRPAGAWRARPCDSRSSSRARIPSTCSSTDFISSPRCLDHFETQGCARRAPARPHTTRSKHPRISESAVRTLQSFHHD